MWLFLSFFLMLQLKSLDLKCMLYFLFGKENFFSLKGELLQYLFSNFYLSPLSFKFCICVKRNSENKIYIKKNNLLIFVTKLTSFDYVFNQWEWVVEIINSFI